MKTPVTTEPTLEQALEPSDFHKRIDELWALIAPRIAAIPGFESRIDLAGFKDRVDSEWDKYLYLQWERGWGVNISVKLHLEPVANVRKNFQSEADKLWQMQAELSWSSTGHSVASALSSAALIRDVTELAAICETQWSLWRVGYDPQAKAKYYVRSAAKEKAATN